MSGSGFEARARRLAEFLSGRRLIACMISIQTAVCLALAALAPPEARGILVTAAASCLAAGLAVALLRGPAWRPSPRAGPAPPGLHGDLHWLLLGLAGGALYAAYKTPWPDELAIRKVAALFADEGIVDFFRKYTGVRWAGTQHPPLAGIVYGMTFRLAGHELFYLRLVSLMMAAAALHATCAAGAEMIDRRIGPAAAALLLAMPATLRVGATALVGVTVMGTGLVVLLLVWRMAAGEAHPREALKAGLAAGAGLLTHYTAVLVFPILAGWYVVLPGLRRRKRELALLVLTATAMLTAWLWVAAYFSILEGQVERLTDHAGVVARSAAGKRLLMRMLLFSIPGALGVYLLPLIVKGAALLAVERRRALGPLSIWIFVPLAIVGATLPDFRYTLLSFPAIAMIAAVGWTQEEPPVRVRILWLSLVYCAATLILLNEVTPTAIVFR